MKNKLDEQAYKEFSEARNGRCDICGNVFDKLHVDHSHATGAVRGMLCSKHNTGLGFFQDDPKLLQSAIAYLNKTPIPVKRKIVIPRSKKTYRSVKVNLEVQHVVTVGAADIGAAVRTLRKASGLRQAEAAALCNVGTRFLSDLENGKPTLQVDMVVKVLRSFGVQMVLKKKSLSGIKEQD